jgi:hypothetical protein
MVTLIKFREADTTYEVPIMQSFPTSCHYLTLRSKYSPQHPVFKHSQSMSSYCEGPRFTPIQNKR